MMTQEERWVANWKEIMDFMEYKKSYSSKKKDSRNYESKDLRKDGDAKRGDSDSRNQGITEKSPWIRRSVNSRIR